MEIREIHIDEYGCWRNVSIHSIPAQLSLIHLDDGARPIDFARFLSLALPRSEAHASGWLRIVQQRQSDDRETLETAPSESRKDIPTPLIVPTSDPHACWDWLATQPQMARQLLAAHPDRRLTRLQQAAQLPLNSHGQVLDQLQAEREHLLTELATRPRIEKQASSTNPAGKNSDLIAELKDDLRILQRQLGPLQEAASLSEKWSELQQLKQRPTTQQDAADLRAKLKAYLSLEAEKEACLKMRSSSQPPKVVSTRATQRQIQRLLKQRDRVLKSVQAPRVHSAELDQETHTELQHAAYLFKSAKQACERAERRLSAFSRQHEFDWSTLLVDDIAPARIEIRDDSPIAQEPPAHQLAELQRRRRWVREEYRCLVHRQEASGSQTICIAVLLALSIATLFGLLLISSTLTQWALVCCGLGGIVAAGAMKLSLERRRARALHRTQSRLQQIDREIQVLGDQVSAEQQDASESRQRAAQKLQALQLHTQLNEAHREQDSAERTFRELLDVLGLPLTLSPDDLERDHARRERYARSAPADHQLVQWIRKARDIIQRVDGVRPGKDPERLLTLLESIHDHMQELPAQQPRVRRRANKTSGSASSKRLRQIEQRQRSVLRKAKVDDRIQLESAIELAEEGLRARKRINTLQLELSVAIESHEDSEEVRELLELLRPQELKSRLEDRQRQIDETQAALQEHTDRPPTAPRPVASPSPEFDRKRLQLAVLDTRIRQTIRSGQVGVVFRQVASELLKRTTDVPRPTMLSQLSNRRWETIQSTRDGFFLTNSQGDEELVTTSPDAGLAWLALQIDYAQANNTPLVLLADVLLATRRAASILSCIEKVAGHGTQTVLLTGNRQLVNQLREANIPIVRVGLQEHPVPQSPTTSSQLGRAA